MTVEELAEVVEQHQEILERLVETLDNVTAAQLLLTLDLIEEGVIPDRREQR